MWIFYEPKKGIVMKYTTFCRGIYWDCLESPKQKKKIKWSINNIDNQLDEKITAF